ncbi:MAG: MBL fold metallo-hydrolase [Candidatus Eremiobacteraeota bacterium]|nr:MBL fold metallo-hydrolase [Candidatus Eremiobacteraeota bacterium]
MLVCDFGTGAFANYRRCLPCPELDAVVISHMHADHFLDLISLRNALSYGQQRRGTKLPVYLPASGEQWLRGVGVAVGSDSHKDFFNEVFDIKAYDAGCTLVIADFQLSFAKTVHYIDAYAIRVQTKRGAITYSADTAPCANVVNLARDSDLFVCECTLGANGSESGRRGHSSAREAALMAEEAHVGKLLLTHYGSESSPQHLVAEASRYFTAECDAADDLMQLRVPDAR